MHGNQRRTYFMLKAAIRTLDEVEEAQRELYRQEGEVFVLNVEGVMSRCVVHHVDREIPGECELDEAINSVI
jgi:hypothetical protein